MLLLGKRSHSHAWCFAAWAGHGWAEGLSPVGTGQPSPLHFSLPQAVKHPLKPVALLVSQSQAAERSHSVDGAILAQDMQTSWKMRGEHSLGVKQTEQGRNTFLALSFFPSFSGGANLIFKVFDLLILLGKELEPKIINKGLRMWEAQV